MIFVGIDVAKNKHNCVITNTEGYVLFKSFSRTSNLDEFDGLYQKIESFMKTVTTVQEGLEATGLYIYTLLEYILDKVLPTYVSNQNLYRKSLILRQTKTDTVDTHTYHNKELKALTHYRFDTVKELSKLKISISRPVCILFSDL